MRKGHNKANSFSAWCKANGHEIVANQINKEREKKNQARKFWLEKFVNTEIPENFVNDKRKFYREEYLKSDHWKELRMRKICSHPKCEKCPSTLRLDVHHLNYKNLYDVELSDLQVLCRKCHTIEHDEEPKKKSKRDIVADVKEIDPCECGTKIVMSKEERRKEIDNIKRTRIVAASYKGQDYYAKQNKRKSFGQIY